MRHEPLRDPDERRVGMVRRRHPSVGRLAVRAFDQLLPGLGPGHAVAVVGESMCLWNASSRCCNCSSNSVTIQVSHSQKPLLVNIALRYLDQVESRATAL